ncbi:MAG: UDP-N-acetylglucosamine--N-acetylmuramyl-(pentapeptide) pyrophosphoryl-undecaprenol N-acetylglucosamine transferase [Chitinispirillaceae bacterium]
MNRKQKKNSHRVLLAAGGFKGKYIPALSVALELRKCSRNISLMWIGNDKGKERSLCRKHRIPFIKSSFDENGKTSGIIHCLREFFRFNSLFAKERPSAVLAFGSFESVPVLAAARLRSVPYFLLEQNAVPGKVNRFFASGAKKVFFGLPPIDLQSSDSSSEVTGVPVWPFVKEYDQSFYPRRLDRSRKTVFIAGDDEKESFIFLVDLVKMWARNGIQVVWQTGKKHYGQIRSALKSCEGVFLFPVLQNTYPFYAISRVVIGRGFPSLLSEAAFFGLPCVLIPYSSDSAQWVNAGLVKNQGWAFRFAQSEECKEGIDEAVRTVLENDEVFEKMSRKALDQSPFNASSRITGLIAEELGVTA